MSNLDFGDAATQDIRGAVQYLKGTSPRVAVIGFCMGGVLFNTCAKISQFRESNGEEEGSRLHNL
jgi:dienelactone hydrolase